MAHKTLIDGTAYEIIGGSTRIDGTGYSIVGGKTRIDGTAYDISFGRYRWCGWQNATWYDINRLCVAKANGEISAFPDDIVLGESTKQLTINSPIGGLPTTVTAVAVAFDVQPNTIVFGIRPDSTTHTKVAWSDTTPSLWNTSLVHQYCYDLYTIGTEVNNYLVQVEKRTTNDYNSNNVYPSYTHVYERFYYYLPSRREETNWGGIYESSSLEGENVGGPIRYGIYTTNAGGNEPVWSRSRAQDTGTDVYINIVGGGNRLYEYKATEALAYFAPWFTIGNPNAV